MIGCRVRAIESSGADCLPDLAETRATVLLVVGSGLDLGGERDHSERRDAFSDLLKEINAENTTMEK